MFTYVYKNYSPNFIETEYASEKIKNKKTRNEFLEQLDNHI